MIGEWFTWVNADGSIDYLGQVDDDARRVVIVNSFDRLAIASAGKLYHWPINGGTSFVTDVDLGYVLDVVWIAGYFMTTDGANLIVTDLNDLLSVNPPKYGSSEVLPDSINSLLVIRNEVYAVNRYSVEVLPERRRKPVPVPPHRWRHDPEGLQSPATPAATSSTASPSSAAARTRACRCGSARWVGPTSWRRPRWSASCRTTPRHSFSRSSWSRAWTACMRCSYIHLPDKTLVYDHAASLDIGTPIWTVQTSGANGDQAYRARGFVRAYDKWLSRRQPELAHRLPSAPATRGSSAETVPWQFDTLFCVQRGPRRDRIRSSWCACPAGRRSEPVSAGDRRDRHRRQLVRRRYHSLQPRFGGKAAGRARGLGDRAPARPDVALPQLPIPGHEQPVPGRLRPL